LKILQEGLLQSKLYELCWVRFAACCESWMPGCYKFTFQVLRSLV